MKPPKYQSCVPSPACFLCSLGRGEAKARAATTSRTIWVGNLAFVTTDAQLFAAFSQCGAVERIIMGLNAKTKTSAGFAYVM